MNLIEVKYRPTELYETHRAIVAGLSTSQKDLAAEYGLDAFLAVETVRRRHRAAGRLIIPAPKVETFVELLRRLSIAAVVGRLSVAQSADVVSGSGHLGHFVRDRTGTLPTLVYFSLEKDLARGAETAEAHTRHDLLGDLFGYPSCCVNKFITSPQDGADHTATAIYSRGPFRRVMNPVISYVYRSVSTLFHFPCSLDCEASTALRLQRLRLLEEVSADATKLRDVGAGIALYGPTIGIGLVTRFSRLGDQRFKVLEMHTSSNETASLFSRLQSSQLELSDGHAITLDGRSYTAPVQFAALFE